MKVRSKVGSLSQENGLRVPQENVSLPKTRFTVNDRPCSSPRLKYIPAERIKSLDSEENPQTKAEASNEINAGQGDAPVKNFVHGSQALTHSLAPRNKNICRMNELEDSPVSWLTSVQVNQPQAIINSAPSVALDNQPPRRLPVSHSNHTLGHQLPVKIVDPTPHQTSRSADQLQAPGYCQEQLNQYQSNDPSGVENDSMSPPRLQLQTFGHVYRPVSRPKGVQGDRNDNDKIGNVQMVTLRSMTHPTVSDHFNHVQEAKAAGYSWPVYQGYNQHFPHYSTQSATIRQNNALNPWVENTGAQSYSMNIKTADEMHPCTVGCPEGLSMNGNQMGLNPYQVSNGNRQMQQRQYFFNQNQTPDRAQPANNFRTSNNDCHLNSERHKNRKALTFSSAMIKDQEMLLATMRQQGIPEDIMKRQFDGLLAEQRKQLLYREQLIERQSNEPNNKSQGRRVNRKISKTDEDGKPEWMLHITPPRIPYSFIEKERSLTSDTEKYEWNENEVRLYKETAEIQGQRNHQLDQYHQYQQSWQNGVNAVPEEPQLSSSDQQSNKRLETSSLLKLRLYKDVIKKQQQNNGLQDPETVAKAMTVLKNSRKWSGLEYIDNTNQKRDKPLLLNGAQNPVEMTHVVNPSQTGQCLLEPARMPSADRMKNCIYSNNSTDPMKLHMKKTIHSQWSEYPRQRSKSSSRDAHSGIMDCYTLSPAIVPQNSARPNQSLTYPMCNQTSSESIDPLPTQLYRIKVRRENGSAQNQSTPYTLNQRENGSAQNQSTPYTFNHVNWHQYQGGQMPHATVERRSNNYRESGMVVNQCGLAPQSGFSLGETVNGTNEKAQPGSFEDNNSIQEIIVPGRLKYFARKPKYINHPSFATVH